MSSRPKLFFIVGCQRSGSTLVEAIFNAHPDVRVIGEEGWAAYGYFENPVRLVALTDEWVCLRIPAATHQLEHAIEHFPGARVLFMLRDPRDVAVSMRDLKMRGGGTWLARRAHREILNTLAALPDRERQEERYRQLRDEIDDPCDVRFGGFCWAVKNRFVPAYLHSPLPTKLVRYEVLTDEPEPYLRQICAHLELEWTDRLLEHEQHSSGAFFGTDKGEAIHRRSNQSYKTGLTMDERRHLHSVVGADMEMLGYVELFD